MKNDFDQRRHLQGLSRTELAALQLEKLNRLLDEILPQNQFYAEKLGPIERPVSSLEAIREWPLTEKHELQADGPFAANLTFPPENYLRFHRTSGTKGSPMSVLDTAADWEWWINTWQFVLDAAQLERGDRVLMAFSFGPFIGFWSAFDAVLKRGIMALPGGGLSSMARLEMLRANQATALFCTPTYALHLAEIARENKIDSGSLGIRKVVVAGEPGGSVPAIRARIENDWQAELIDHAGATEIGPWGVGDAQQHGLHVIESEFLAEFLNIETQAPAQPGELSELVLSNLGRTGAPLLRYRTGDLVKPRWDSSKASNFVLLEGGVLGRADDMLIIRGVNIFPSSLEQILRSFTEVVEYRITARKSGEMDSLSIEIEDKADDPARVAKQMEAQLGLKVQIASVPLGSLPRFEAKGRRFIDER